MTTPIRSPLHQRDVGGFHGHVGAGADRHADVGLRQRRRIVDAVAHHGHDLALLLQLLDLGGLVAGQHSASTRSMPACWAMASAVRWLSPVIMATVSPSLRSGGHGLRRCALERVGDGDHAGQIVLNGDQHNGLAVAFQRVAISARSPAAISCLVHQPAVAQQQRWPSTSPDALAGDGLEASSGARVSPAHGHSRRSPRPAGARSPLGAGCQRQQSPRRLAMPFCRHAAARGSG